MNTLPGLALYTYWYTCRQRPHHLVAALQNSVAVSVYSWRGIRIENNPKSLLGPSDALRVRYMLSDRLRWMDFAQRINSRQRNALLCDFAADPADVHIFAAVPDGPLPFKPKILIYDSMDEWSAFPSIDRKRSVVAMERELCRMADRVWAVSRPLAQRLSEEFGCKVDYVPNGVDVGHFVEAVEMRSNKTATRPTLGYVGTIDEWFDARLVGGVARLLKDWRIVLVGTDRLDSARRAFLDRPNISFLGYQPYEALPGLMSGFDVAMIPFTINALTKAASPIKMYEYMAAGLPVVSTPLPEVIALKESGVVACAEDESHFAALVVQMADCSRPERSLALALENRWEARFKNALAWTGITGRR